MRGLLAFLLAVSLLSLAVAVLAWQRSSRAVMRVRPIEEELVRLRQRIGDLEPAVRALASRLGSLAARPELREPTAEEARSGGGGRGPADGLEEVAERVKEVEIRLQDLEARSSRPLLPGLDPQVPETEEARRAMVASNQAVVTDRSRTTRERLEALRALRFRDGRSEEVIRAMIELIQDPDLDRATRADIIRNLDGVESPELKQPLLAVLENDADPDTRSEAVETLEAFYGDLAVHAAIVRVRDHDPDARVRVEALKRLGEYEIRRQIEERLPEGRPEGR